MKEQRIPKLWENLNATWGGETGNGLIEDPNVTKEVGKMYIGSDGKAYICLNPSNINNSENYMPCNVVDNLNKLQNLIHIHKFSATNYVNLNREGYTGYDISELIDSGYNLFLVLIGSFGCCQLHMLSPISEVNTGYYGVSSSQTGLSSIHLSNKKICFKGDLYGAVPQNTSVNLHGIIAVRA